MAVFCTVLESLVKKRHFFIAALYHDSIEPRRILPQNLNTKCPSPWLLDGAKNIVP